MSEEKAPEKAPQLVRRIDRSTVVGDKTALLKRVLSDEKKTHFLYRVGGAAVGVVSGSSNFGDWIKLVGRFQAINADGEVFRSGAAFLPGDVSQMIADRLAKNDSEEGYVTFLYDIFARHDTTIATGYGYIAEPVSDPTKADPLDTLFSTAKALPGPSQAALPAPDSDKGKKSK